MSSFDFKPLKLGVMGYGHYIRTNYIKHLRVIPAVEIVGVYNRGEERRKQAEDDGFRATSNLDEFLSRGDIEAVLIGTANEAHREHAVAAAAAGKHILCEKPLALSIGEMDDMLAAAEKARVITHVNHSGVYTEAFERFKELMDANCGRVMQVWVRSSRLFGTWKMGARHFAVANPQVSGGWTFRHYCHQLNEACVLLNMQRATKVYHVNQKSCPEAPSEELCTSMITFADGSVASICDGTTIGGFRDLGACGTDGDIRHVGDEIVVITHGEPDPMQRPGNRSQVIRRFPVPPVTKVMEKVATIFAAAVRTGDATRLLSFRHIRHEYEILDALRQSAATGKTVELPPAQ